MNIELLKKPFILSFAILAGCSWQVNREPIVVAARHDALEYEGLWQVSEETAMTIYPGSSIRFFLNGQATLTYRAEDPENLRIRVIRDGKENIYDGPAHSGLELKSRFGGSEFELLYVAKKFRGFDGRRPGHERAEFTFTGLQLAPRSHLRPVKESRDGPAILVVGDSISIGAFLGGRHLPRVQSDDVAASFAFQVIDEFQGSYRIKTHSGHSIADIRRNFTYFQHNRPIPKGFDPDWILINVGANDTSHQEAFFLDQLMALVDHVRDTHAQGKIVLLNFFHMEPDRTHLMNQVVEHFGNAGVLAFDCRPYLKGFTDANVHPDRQSHRLLAKALIDFMQRHETKQREES